MAQGGGLKAVEGHAWSGAGHVSPAESDGQLQVLLLLEPQLPQPLLLLMLALPLGPFQLLVLTSELEQRNKHEMWTKTQRIGLKCEHKQRELTGRKHGVGCKSQKSNVSN